MLNAKAELKPMSHAERLHHLSVAEHRVCAREHKLLKPMLGDGRCGWRMAAHVLFGNSQWWTAAKKLLVDAAAGDYHLFLELRAMTAEERAGYFNSLRSLNADEEQQFDLTMLQVLGWCMGAPIKVLSAVAAYDDAVYASELAQALCEARAIAVPAPICVVCVCSLRSGTCARGSHSQWRHQPLAFCRTGTGRTSPASAQRTGMWLWRQRAPVPDTSRLYRGTHAERWQGPCWRRRHGSRQPRNCRLLLDAGWPPGLSPWCAAR